MDICNIKERLTLQETEQMAQLKRVSQCLQADRQLFEAAVQNKFTPEQISYFKEIGVNFELKDIAFLWENYDNICNHIILSGKKNTPEISNEDKAIIKKYPLYETWLKSIKRCVNFLELSEKYKEMKSFDEKFNAWRLRRIAATKSELGFFGVTIDHPIMAFELNDGCSVGCWFCSFAAHKLSKTLDYPKERGYVLNIIKHCTDIFGREMAGMALPYYRTEPHDNPHYIDFLKDYEKITGAVLCTSTAVCHDIEWVKKLLDYYQKDRKDGERYNWPRLSILSLDMLKKVHRAFSPVELKDIDLLIQVKDSKSVKVSGGRILQEKAGLRSRKDFTDRKNLALSVPQGSIACVSGFNINLVTHEIMLFSPCYTGKKWPYGFRVFDQAKYRDDTDFPEVMKNMIERNMFFSPPKNKPLKFRDDIVFRKIQGGFDLATPNQLHHFKGEAKYGPLGLLIAEGVYTYGQISENLLKNHKVNPLVLSTVVQKLFDDGLIDEVYCNQ